jgi:hypothetical protein
LTDRFLFYTPGNIPRFVGFTTHCGNPDGFIVSQQTFVVPQQTIGRHLSLGRSTMLDALNRAERCRDLTHECRRLAATSSIRQMRKRYSRLAEHYGLSAEVEQFARSLLVAAAILGVVSSGVALAETATPSSSTSIVDDISNWASKQWNLAKAEWAKGKEKWADCQKQSNDQNLNGAESWKFLVGCMTS